MVDVNHLQTGSGGPAERGPKTRMFEKCSVQKNGQIPSTEKALGLKEGHGCILANI